MFEKGTLDVERWEKEGVSEVHLGTWNSLAGWSKSIRILPFKDRVFLYLADVHRHHFQNGRSN
jgi:hypothetical protein